MSYIESFVPGQISLPNYVDVPVVPPPGGTVKWDDVVGQYAKIEGYQYNLNLVANHAHMPNPYNPNLAGHANTIFGELDRKRWLRGILIEVEWGRTETAPGVWDWEFLDFVFNTIRGLPKATGKDKRVLLLVNLRHVASLTGLEDFLPADLLTQPAANGGYYRNPTTYPPTFTSSIRNAKKFDHCWCYEGAIPGLDGTGEGEPKGYNFNCYKFAAAAGTNVLKTRFYAFLDAIQDRYGNDEVFAGLVTTEAAIGTPFIGYEPGNGRNPHYEGRLNIAKQMRSVFQNRIVVECANFDFQYYKDVTNAGVQDGLIANRLGFTHSNIHLGTNMHLENVRTVLTGKIPIVMQIQPLDMRTKTGNRPQYYNWPTNPNQVLSGDGIDDNDPAPPQFLFDRLKYWKSNLSIIQRNFTPDLSSNWNGWKAFMDVGPHADDPVGGLDPTKPQFVA